MYNETYDEYIRSVLGYPSNNLYNNYQDFSNQNNIYDTRNNGELEKCYPEIYKIVYPMITTKCNNIRANLTSEDIENMTDEIYYALEEKSQIQLNINLNNDVRTTDVSNYKPTKVADKKPEVKVTESASLAEDGKRETRQVNRGLRDLIKILLIRELLNRPGRPQHPHPPMPPRPRPPRPPMRPHFNQGPGMMPFNNREFDPSSYDIFEY